MTNHKMPAGRSESYYLVARGSTSLTELPALSVRQPWAWLIVSGLKDIENRPRPTHYRGPLLIHAGLSLESCNEENVAWLNQKYEIHTDETLGCTTKPECARPRAQQRENAKRPWKTSTSRCHPALLRPGTGALRCRLSCGPGSTTG